MESCVNWCNWYAAPQRRPPRDWLMRMKNGGVLRARSGNPAYLQGLSAACMLLSQAVANCIFRAEGFSLHWQGKPSNENRITPNMKHVESLNPRDLITVQPPSGSKIMKPNFPQTPIFQNSFVQAIQIRAIDDSGMWVPTKSRNKVKSVRPTIYWLS